MLRPISMPVKTRCRFTDYRKSVDSMILTIAVSSQNLKNGESYDGLIRCFITKSEKRGILRWAYPLHGAEMAELLSSNR